MCNRQILNKLLHMYRASLQEAEVRFSLILAPDSRSYDDTVVGEDPIVKRNPYPPVFLNNGRMHSGIQEDEGSGHGLARTIIAG